MMTTCPPEARKDRLIHERVHDPYRTKCKPPEPSMCPVCHAVFEDGRWQWRESWPTDSYQEICQACQRVRDNYPAGLLTLSGEFVRTRRAELLNLARNREQAECARHPLHRIIKIEERSDEMVISTTDIHLPKCIGEAVHRAHKGRLHLHYEKGGCFVRAQWTSKP